MAKLLQLTENSWLIKDTIEQYLLFNKGEYFNLISETESKKYNTFKDVEKRFGKFVKETVKDTIDNQKIMGYNVRHKEEIIDKSNTLPIYCKKGSNVEFLAGYWIVKQSNNWNLTNCPKKNTIDNNKHEGPFLNRMEALNRTTILNSMKG